MSEYLVVCAVAGEARYVPAGVPLVVTGVGKTPAAVAVSRALAERDTSDLVVLNVGTTGLEAGSGTHYIPRWSEVAVTLSIVAAGFAIFRFVAGYFPVFEAHSHEAAAAKVEEKEEDPVEVA